MFKEFNVEFQNVEMIGGADNLLENTKVTKVVMSGDNKMSSLDSTFKNCSELDNVQGGLDLNGVSDIDNILEGNTLIKSIDLKNINNENISANNSFPYIEEINIGGELYNKKAMQNVIASKDWTFDNLTYSGIVGDNIVTKEVDIVDDNNKVTIKDSLEQKAKNLEIVGQTYENLADGKGEYKLSDTIEERTISESEIANGIENPPSAIEITSLWGNTYQNPNNLNEIKSLGELYIDKEGNPILDEEGNEQYILELISNNGVGNSNKTTILMPQQLRKVGDICDKIYWDSNNNKFFLEKNIGKFIVPKGGNWIKQGVANSLCRFSLAITDGLLRAGYSLCNYFTHTDDTYWAEQENTYCYEGTYLRIVQRNSVSLEDFKSFIDSINVYVLGKLKLQEIVETKILEKPSLKTYSPKTYITTNTGIQPSQMTVNNKRNLINLKKMKANTDYTVQLKCNEKGNKPIKINLCGKEKDIDATIGVNHVNITTNELNDNKLELSGEGNIVSEIIVVEGEMNQYPEYFNGVQSTGELQDDGTYKIDITTENEFKNINLWDGKKVSDYATDFIEIYDNTFSLNSYDAYITEYDADRQLVTREYITSTANKVLTAKNSNCKYITVRSNIFKETDTHYVKEGLLVLSNRMVSFKEKPTGFRNSLKVLISSNSPLAKGDKLYWNKSNKRYEIDRNGDIEVPIVEGDVVDLPRLYQREDTTLVVETGNIKPSKIKINYHDID